MRRTTALATTVLALALSLGTAACSEVENAAKDAAGDAACSSARSAIDEAKQQADQATQELRTDPEGAQRDLTAVRDGLAAAGGVVDGDLEQQLKEAKASVERLIGQAQDAMDGADIDTQAVDHARADLDAAVEDVKDAC